MLPEQHENDVVLLLYECDEATLSNLWNREQSVLLSAAAAEVLTRRCPLIHTGDLLSLFQSGEATL